MAERTAVDENFSRSFRFVPSDEGECSHGESALSRAVYSAVALLETVCPEVECGKELELAHQTLLTNKSQGFRINIEVPKYRKDPKKAEGLLRKKNPNLQDLNDCLRLLNPDQKKEQAEAFARRADLLMGKCGKSQLAAAANLESACSTGWGDRELRVRAAHRAAQLRSKAGDRNGAAKALKLALNTMGEEEMEKFGQGIKTALDKLEKKIGKEIEQDVGDRFDLLERRHSPDRGRYLVAGDGGVDCGVVLARETPAVSLLNPDSLTHLYKYCWRCLINCSSSFLPCHTCSSAVFCSPECRSEALESFHRFECRVNMGRLRAEGDSDSYRMLLTARAFFQRPLAQVLSAAQDAENRPSTAMPAGESKVDDDYIALFSMTTHAPTSTRQRLKQAAMAAAVVGLLRNSGYLNNYNENVWEILCAAHKLVQVQDVNTHPIMAMDGDDNGGLEVGLSRIGNVINVRVGSLINHSCNPNTCRINVGNRTLVVSTRRIAPGEEVCDIYSMHYSEVSAEDRIEWLETNFFFRCRCLACRKRFPVFGDLPGKVEPQLADKLRVLERLLADSLRKRNYEEALRLHFRVVSLIEEGVKEPHRLYVTSRNSLQFCLWRVHAN